MAASRQSANLQPVRLLTPPLERKQEKWEIQKHKAKTLTVTPPLTPPFTYPVTPPRFLTWMQMWWISAPPSSARWPLQRARCKVQVPAVQLINIGEQAVLKCWLVSFPKHSLGESSRLYPNVTNGSLARANLCGARFPPVMRFEPGIWIWTRWSRVCYHGVGSFITFVKSSFSFCCFFSVFSAWSWLKMQTSIQKTYG